MNFLHSIIQGLQSRELVTKLNGFAVSRNGLMQKFLDSRKVRALQSLFGPGLVQTKGRVGASMWVFPINLLSAANDFSLGERHRINGEFNGPVITVVVNIVSDSGGHICKVAPGIIENRQILGNLALEGPRGVLGSPSGVPT
jgi:hypothetical protein